MEEVTEFDATKAMKDIRGSKVPWVLFVLALGGGAGGIYWFRAQLELAQREIASVRAGIEAKDKELVLAQKSADELRRKTEQLESQNVELATTNARLSSDVTAKEEELAKLKGTYDQLQEKMKKEIGSGEIRLSNAGGKLQVDLVDKILFDSGDANISKRGEEVLGRIGQILATISDKQIQVSGHTDTMPISEKLTSQFPTNWELSVARATNVVRYLQEKASVPEKLLVASGYGAHHPVAANTSPAGRARNRRIEILLTPLMQPVEKSGPAKKS